MIFRKYPFLSYFISILILTVVYWSFIGLNIQWLRAESGQYLIISSYDINSILSFMASRFSNSYNGHYTPILFNLEIVQSFILGTNEILWKIRQAMGFSLLSLVTFMTFRSALQNNQGTVIASFVAFCVTAVFMLQPLMLDLVSWPFMMMQILFIALFLLAAYHLISFGRTPAKASSLWLATACGYGTMHCLGTGVAVALSLIACLLVLLILSYCDHGELREQRRHLIWTLTALSILTSVHALMMLRTPDVDVSTTGVGIVEAVRRLGGLFPAILFNSVRAMWAPQGFPWPNAKAIGSDAVYGWAMISMLLAIGIHLLREYSLNPTGEKLSTLLVYLYAVLTLLVIINLIVFRTSSNFDIEILLSYLIGGRYLILIGICLLVIVAVLGMNGRPWHSGLTVSLSIMIAITGLVGNFVFAREMMPSIWPNTLISHSKVWDAATAYVRQAVTAGGPVEDVNMDKVSIEFRFRLSTFEPLLRRSLDLPDSTELIWHMPEQGLGDAHDGPALSEARDALRSLFH